jgi:basic amino acid/polyamine antiporter, APA family
VDPDTTAGESPQGGLLHILGVSFGIAGAVGGTIGAGILRTPGLVAAQLGSAPLIVAAWVAGALYALLGALAVAELGTSLPRAGGWTVYARRALGDQAGFSVGWIDWVGHCAGLAWVAVTIGDYTIGLLPALPVGGKVVALIVLLGFALIQRLGVEAGSLSQKILSLGKALAFLGLIVACFLHAPVRELAGVAEPLLESAAAPGPAAAGGISLGIGVVFAMQAVITTYDGWHSPIYFAEEFADPSRDLPRSLVGGVLSVAGLYLLVNLALLRLLPVPRIAASVLPLADAAEVLFGAWSSQLISRDGLFLPQFATVSASGTPVLGLALTTVGAGLLVSFGDFTILLGIASFLYVLLYLSGITALFLLRWREPGLERPFRDPGYPLSAAIVWLGSLAFLVAAIRNDTANSAWALGLILLSLPLHQLTRQVVPPQA